MTRADEDGVEEEEDEDIPPYTPQGSAGGASKSANGYAGVGTQGHALLYDRSTIIHSDGWHFSGEKVPWMEVDNMSIIE